MMNIDNIAKAFALAHKAAENYDTPPKEAAIFRAIADQLWAATGISPLPTQEVTN